MMFRHPERARRTLAEVESALHPETRRVLESLLSQSPDPDTVLHSLERYLSVAGPRALEDGAGLLLRGSRLHALLAIFGYSRFLSDTLFHHPALLEWVLTEADLYRVLSVEEMRSRLGPFRPEEMDRPAVALELARFKRQHLLRIMLRDVLGVATLGEVTLELSHLADVILDAAWERVHEELTALHGRPMLAGPGAARECEFSLLALGKLGGQELNYSSDIDLLYLFSGTGETEGPKKITNKEFFIKTANQLTDVLSSNTTEGLCYRVDLRLRPEGALGEVAISLAGAKDYYQRRARDWELQMLIKARVAGGSRALGREFLEFAEPLIYKTTTDFSAVESVSETRERIHEKLRRRSPGGINVKLNYGGIRDIEFLVQCLQRLYGGRDPWVRHGGTLFALHRLRDKGYITSRDYARLNSAYQFLRTLEHRLQLENDRQTHTLPSDPEGRETLARKMAFSSAPEAGDIARFLVEETQRHFREVTEIYERVIHGHGPPPAPGSEGAPLFQLEMVNPEQTPELSMQAQLRYLERRAPEFGARIAAAPVKRGRRLFEHFWGQILSAPDLLAELEQKPELVDLAADLFEHSPFFAEWLIRNPEEVNELLEVAEFESSDQQPRLFDLEGEGQRSREHPELEHLIQTQAPVSVKSSWLRRFYRRQMLRIQTESICRRSPIFATLEQTTELGDWVVAAAYRIALDETRRAHPAVSGSPMHVVALGRLGMREFDLGSDADLVFILPEDAQGDRPFWIRVAERTIDLLASYTGEGLLFSVDTRLRPMGREGELVQTEGRYKKYFAEQAQAWEAITYMKTRCVAGDIERGTAFLHDLQNVDWRRYGQSGSLAALLIDMRHKLEKEQGPAQPLKAGCGGYYDIDFMLMYLRLRGAGIFYRSLNTPERIEVIERMGLLSREDADFLRSAAVFYRALDHGLRVMTGRSQAALPRATSQAEILRELLRRWTPAVLHGRPVEETVEEMRRRTREMFEKVFEGTR
jgi:glutamate-ammonia-ligase adenylyltransferase